MRVVGLMLVVVMLVVIMLMVIMLMVVNADGGDRSWIGRR